MSSGPRPCCFASFPPPAGRRPTQVRWDEFGKYTKSPRLVAIGRPGEIPNTSRPPPPPPRPPHPPLFSQPTVLPWMMLAASTLDRQSHVIVGSGHTTTPRHRPREFHYSSAEEIDARHLKGHCVDLDKQCPTTVQTHNFIIREAITPTQKYWINK